MRGDAHHDLPHSHQDQIGAISPYIWWHNEVCSGLDEIWSAHQEFRGRAGGLSFQNWVALQREQERPLEGLGGVLV